MIAAGHLARMGAHQHRQATFLHGLWRADCHGLQLHGLWHTLRWVHGWDGWWGPLMETMLQFGWLKNWTGMCKYIWETRYYTWRAFPPCQLLVWMLLSAATQGTHFAVCNYFEFERTHLIPTQKKKQAERPFDNSWPANPESAFVGKNPPKKFMHAVFQRWVFPKIVVPQIG